MVPVLDEASLIPCAAHPPSLQVRQLAATLRALDQLGAPRALRSVRDAPDRDLGAGRGLRSWCFDRGTDRDSGRLVALRLGAQPYIDGPDGLFAVAEGGRAVDAFVGGIRVFGAGYVALTDGLSVLVQTSAWPPVRPVTVQLDLLADDEQWTEQVPISTVDSEAEVEAQREILTRKIEGSVANGRALVDRLPELCPCLTLGSRAADQIEALTGSEAYFGQVVRHLRALNQAAEAWSGGSYQPDGVTFSVESGPTLAHGTYGPMREFPTPDEFPAGRWTLHTKLTGGPGARLYYKTSEFELEAGTEGSALRLRVAIGYLGPHLPTVRFH